MKMHCLVSYNFRECVAQRCRGFKDHFLEDLRRLCKLASRCSVSLPVESVGGRLRSEPVFLPQLKSSFTACLV